MTITRQLLEKCAEEWEFFNRSRINANGSSIVGLREYDDGAWQRIGDYWQELGGGYANLTGRDRGVPWSAAFISWLMRQAGAGNAFPYSAGHATYINAAIRNANQGSGKLIGHKLRDYAPKPGDLIGYWRGERPITVDNARRIGWYQSHTDIVVAVDGRTAYSIGGNVMHSVTKRAVKLNANGLIIDRRNNWFVVVENKI